MKLLRLIASTAALLAVAAATPPKPTGLVLIAEIVEVRPERLLARVATYIELRGEQRTARSERAGTFVVLVPGGKCASGDVFELAVREAGIAPAEETFFVGRPLRRYEVVSAKRG